MENSLYIYIYKHEGLFAIPKLKRSEKKLSFECGSIVIEGNYVVHPMDYTILLTNVGLTYGITLF